LIYRLKVKDSRYAKHLMVGPPAEAVGYCDDKVVSSPQLDLGGILNPKILTKGGE